MELTLHTSGLCLTVDTQGAQMTHLQAADGTEYLWQGDPRYWADQAPTLFPFIARLTDDSYTYEGKLYHMGIHGFAAASAFTPVVQEENRLVLELRDNEETRKQYPFAFTLRITFSVQQNQLTVAYHIENHSEKRMPFGIGGHPGFRVPIEEGERFDDYCLTFSGACRPDRVGFTPQVYLSGCNEPFPLENNRDLPLRHSLFDEDAIILQNTAREVTLHSRKSGRQVTVSFPDFPYVGFWHWPKTDAPYCCIEPWSSLPSRQNVVEELSAKSDLIQLKPGCCYDASWSVSIG